mgnify:CR=1 FL=1
MMTRAERWDIPHEEEQHKPATIKRLGPKPKLPPMRTRELEKPKRHPKVVATFQEFHERNGTDLPANEHSYGISPRTDGWRHDKRRRGAAVVRWTEERMAELKAYVDQGLSLDEIGKIYQVSPEAVAKACRRAGLKRPRLHKERAERRPWTAEEIDLLLRLYRAGKKRAEIAEILGRDNHAVCSKLSYELRRPVK